MYYVALLPLLQCI